MEAVAAVVMAIVGAFLLTIGVGKVDCISECLGSGNSMQCRICDFPQGNQYHPLEP
jgi:hypothetical protein